MISCLGIISGRCIYNKKYLCIYKDMRRVVGEHQMEQKQTKMENEMGITISGLGFRVSGLLPSIMETQIGKNIENEKEAQVVSGPGSRRQASGIIPRRDRWVFEKFLI